MAVTFDRSAGSDTSQTDSASTSWSNRRLHDFVLRLFRQARTRQRTLAIDRITAITVHVDSWFMGFQCSHHAPRDEPLKGIIIVCQELLQLTETPPRRQLTNRPVPTAGWGVAGDRGEADEFSGRAAKGPGESTRRDQIRRRMTVKQLGFACHFVAEFTRIQSPPEFLRMQLRSSEAA